MKAITLEDAKSLKCYQRHRLRQKGVFVPAIPRKKGYKQSLDSVHKRAAALRKGKHFNCLVCNSEFWRSQSSIKKGDNKYCSRECYQQSQTGKPKGEVFKAFCKARTGANNPNWRGGITPEHLHIRNSQIYRDWRGAVFVRDDHTCQDCLAKCGDGKDVYLHAHHLKGFAEYPDLRFDIENGVTLCKKCHYKIHTKSPSVKPR